MARKPKTSHPIRKLRNVIPHGREIGMGQAVFAKLIGISQNTLRAVELGQRRLSLSLATKIFVATGVDHRSLFDPNGIPRYFGGIPYTTDSYESYMKTRFDINENLKSAGLKALIDYITIVMEAAADRQKATGFHWAIVEFVKQFCVENKLEYTLNLKLKDKGYGNIKFTVLSILTAMHALVLPSPIDSERGESPKSSPRP